MELIDTVFSVISGFVTIYQEIEGFENTTSTRYSDVTKKEIKTSGQFPKDGPKTHWERLQRVSEISKVVGYDRDQKVYYCKLRYVNPATTVEFYEDEFMIVPKLKRMSLLKNLKVSIESDLPEGEKEICTEKPDRTV